MNRWALTLLSQMWKGVRSVDRALQARISIKHQYIFVVITSIAPLILCFERVFSNDISSTVKQLYGLAGLAFAVTISISTFRLLYLQFYTSFREGLERPSIGFRLMSIVRFLFPAKDVESIFVQILLDWHEEYFIELAAGNELRAWYINQRYRLAFVLTAVAYVKMKLIKNVVALWKMTS